MAKVLSKSSASKSSPKSKSSGNHLGKISGLNIRGTWCMLFKKNEQAQRGSKLTDEQISREMQRNFPNKKSKVMTDSNLVAWVRTQYNCGNLGNDRPKDSAKSHRYDKNGELMGRGARKASDSGRKPAKAVAAAKAGKSGKGGKFRKSAGVKSKA